MTMSMKKKTIAALLLAGAVLAGCGGRAAADQNGAAAGNEPAALSREEAAQDAEPAGQEAADGQEEAAALEGAEGAQEEEDAVAAEVRNVIMDVLGFADGEGVRFEVDSSLPDGELLYMTLTRGDLNTADCYQAGERIAVSGGKAESMAFSDRGLPLSGSYDLSISLWMNEEQSLIIRSTNGELSPTSVIISAADVAEELRKAAAEKERQAGAEGAGGTEDAQGPEGADGMDSAQGMEGAEGIDGVEGAQGPEAETSQLQFDGSDTSLLRHYLSSAGLPQEEWLRPGRQQGAGNGTQEARVLVTALFTVSVKDRVAVKTSKACQYTFFTEGIPENTSSDVVAGSGSGGETKEEEQYEEEEYEEEEYYEEEDEEADGDDGWVEYEEEDEVVDEIIE